MVTARPAAAEALVFDVSGPYGHFRKPYASASPVTYAVPPPTAIAGLIGAIAGWSRDEVWPSLDRAPWRIAIRLLAPSRRVRAGLNLLPFKPGKTGHRPTPVELLADPAYRIVFHHDDCGTMEQIGAPLESGRTVYTPCLGLASCIATVAFVGRQPVEIVQGRTTLPLDRVIPAAKILDLRIRSGARVIRFRVPARMSGDRLVTRFDEIVVDEALSGAEVDVEGGCRVGGETHILF